MTDNAPEPDYGAEFDTRVRVFEALLGEVLFVLEDAIGKTGIKTHSIVGRVKARSSFLEKIGRKEYGAPFDDMTDLVGSRVVCLFRDDIPRLGEIVRKQFEVLSEENKIEEAADDTFGYMSVHFVCTLPKQFTGPRYDQLKGVAFEIQVRTILMDAWANVSHHLAYKGEASIPAELRRDFNALSGLFYVADLQFQNFYNESVESEQDAEKAVERSPQEVLPVNRSTVAGLFRDLFPDRKHAASAAVSEFVEEAVKAGYSDLKSLREALTRGTPGLERFEGTRRPRRFADIGAARIALAIADPDYEISKYRSRRFAGYRTE